MEYLPSYIWEPVRDHIYGSTNAENQCQLSDWKREFFPESPICSRFFKNCFWHLAQHTTELTEKPNKHEIDISVSDVATPPEPPLPDPMGKSKSWTLAPVIHLSWSLLRTATILAWIGYQPTKTSLIRSHSIRFYCGILFAFILRLCGLRLGCLVVWYHFRFAFVVGCVKGIRMDVVFCVVIAPI
jgi:hypothetical protein